MDLFLILIVLAVILGPIIFIAKMIFFGFLMKKSIDAYLQHQEAFNAAINQQQRMLQSLGESGRIPSATQQMMFRAAFTKAQNELNQLDDLRRQQSDLRLADMRGQAASMGIFID